MPASPESIRADLAAWGVLESQGPPRFTRRFQGALARAAAGLQAVEVEGKEVPGNPVANQAEAALAAFLAGSGHPVTDGHRKFVTALQLALLPPAVRKALGV